MKAGAVLVEVQFQYSSDLIVADGPTSGSLDSGAVYNGDSKGEDSDPKTSVSYRVLNEAWVPESDAHEDFPCERTLLT